MTRNRPWTGVVREVKPVCDGFSINVACSSSMVSYSGGRVSCKRECPFEGGAAVLGAPGGGDDANDEEVPSYVAGFGYNDGVWLAITEEDELG